MEYESGTFYGQGLVTVLDCLGTLASEFSPEKEYYDYVRVMENKLNPFWPGIPAKKHIQRNTYRPGLMIEEGILQIIYLAKQHIVGSEVIRSLHSRKELVNRIPEKIPRLKDEIHESDIEYDAQINTDKGQENEIRENNRAPDPRE